MAENMEGRQAPGATNSRRSDVWPHFIVTRDGNGKVRATCKRCQKSLGAEAKNGTKHLRRHAEKCAGESSLAPPAKRSCRFNQEDECGPDELLPRMIAFHGYPSSIVEDKCFRSFVRSLNPQFLMPSRAVVEGICHSQSEEAMRQLKETLACCYGKISLVADTIETGQGRALYMACHFIDDDWAFHKRIMQVFRVMRFPPYGHSALLGAEDVCLNVPEVIQKQFSVPGPSNKLEEAVRLWGLAGRLFSVGWGGQQLKTCLERKDFLEKFGVPMVHCVTYTSDMLDLIGETFLETLSIRYEEACLKAVKGLHLSHEKRTQNYSELGLNHVARYDKRWYTYYCALEVLHKECPDNNNDQALPEQTTLNPTELADQLARMTPTELQAKVSSMLRPSKSTFKESIFTDLLRKIFGAIYHAFKIISSSSTPTANLCLDELMKLRGILQRETEDCQSDIAKALAYVNLGGFLGGKGAHVVLQEVQDVLDKHLKNDYMYLCIPAVLDPRFKMEYVAKALTEVCGSSDAPAKISEIKKTMEDSFKEHKQKLGNVIVNGGESTSYMAAGTGTAWAAAMDIDGITGMDDWAGDLVPPERSDNEGLDYVAMLPTFDDFHTPELDTEGNTNAQEEGIISNELERYLIDDLVSQEEGAGSFDILMWWKVNRSRYPTVASMARDALAMPTSDLLSPEHIACIRSVMSSYCLTYPEAPTDD